MPSRRRGCLLAAIPLILLGACASPSGVSSDPASEATSSPADDVSTTRHSLLPDPAAEHTIGDTIRLSGGEFVGDQAELVVEEAVLLEPSGAGSAPQYAFLVEVTGLDPETFPYNLRDFSLFDDEAFEYEPLFDGGEEPRLEFGDLPPGERVRGWLTFDGPTDPGYVELQYAPALALEPARVRVLLP